MEKIAEEMAKEISKLRYYVDEEVGELNYQDYEEENIIKEYIEKS